MGDIEGIVSYVVQPVLFSYLNYASKKLNPNDEWDGTATVKDSLSGDDIIVPIVVITEGTIYRMYDQSRGEHFFTKSKEEAEYLESLGWVHEEESDFTVVNATDVDAIPVYRVYNPNSPIGEHQWTTDRTERDMLISAGWQYEGICWRIV